MDANPHESELAVAGALVAFEDCVPRIPSTLHASHFEHHDAALIFELAQCREYISLAVAFARARGISLYEAVTWLTNLADDYAYAGAEGVFEWYCQDVEARAALRLVVPVLEQGIALAKRVLDGERGEYEHMLGWDAPRDAPSVLAIIERNIHTGIEGATKAPDETKR